jgi:hypothetical protein
VSTSSPLARRLAALLAVAAPLAFAGCGRDVNASSEQGAARAKRVADLPAEITRIAAPGAPYRVVAVTNGGTVRGTVRFAGDAPRDTIVRPASDQTVCGAQITDNTVFVSNGRVAGAVVWLVGVRAGKPLPLERRYELTHERCQLVPRVQAAVVGGTVNVRSSDRLVVHETRFVRQTGDLPVLAVTHTNNEGQVVPVEPLLQRPGLVEARCDLHPWTRGWLFAFDHPYFATTGSDGSFSIDAVPPGRYTMVTWHERTGPIAREIEVAAGGTAPADVELKGK